MTNDMKFRTRYNMRLMGKKKVDFSSRNRQWAVYPLLVLSCLIVEMLSLQKIAFRHVHS